MEILFLGTSAGWPLPRLGCLCKICSSVDSKDKRLRPAILVNKSILIDAGFDIYQELTRITDLVPSDIKYLLITHTHPDHISGLYDLSHIYNRNEKLTIVATERIIDEIRKSFGIPLGGAFKTNIVRPLQLIELDGVQAWYIPVVHGKTQAYAVKLKQRKIALYAPEFRKILPSFRKTISDIQLVILDGSSLDERGQAKGHESIKEGISLAKELKARRVFFTNIGHKTDLHNNLQNFVKKEGGPRFSIAYDGLKLTL